MIFIGKIKSHLDGELRVDANELPSHLTCAFGKWYQSHGQSCYGHITKFRDINVPHAKVHALGKQAINAFNNGDKAKAKAFGLYAQMEENSMQLVSILDQLNALGNSKA